MKRFDHQLSPMAPRWLRARMPSFAGRRGPLSAHSHQFRHDRLLFRHRVRGERTISRSSAVESSVSHPSPVPTTRSASSFFRSIISSMRSSSVPAQTSLRTCTFRRCPMRKARSVAWSSTAGFHQRSKWTTWLAAVRFSPVPPAFSERRKTGGPVPALEALHHPVARLPRGPAVQEEHLAAEAPLQVLLQHPPHLGELREDQRPVASGERLLEDVLQQRELARAARQRASGPAGAARGGCRPASASAWWRARGPSARSPRSPRCAAACRPPPPGRARPARASGCSRPSSPASPGGPG